MGPGFGADWGRAIFACLLMALAAGALLGIGCQAACGYALDHVNVEWRP